MTIDVFIHIPKTGGSTIRTILAHVYGIENILYFEPSSPHAFPVNTSKEAFLANALNERNIKLITGHYPFGVHHLLQKPCRYFSMMRDPIERLISDYYFAYSVSYHRYREKICQQKLSIYEYLTNLEFAAERNQQSSMITGHYTNLNKIKSVKKFIKRNYRIIGITERFEESTLLFAKYLGWSVPLFTKKNVTKTKYNKQDEWQETYARIKNNLPPSFVTDHLVYQFVDEYLSTLIQAEGPAFAKALSAFQEIQSEIDILNVEEKYQEYAFTHHDNRSFLINKFCNSEPYRVIEEYLNKDHKPNRFLKYFTRLRQLAISM